MNNASRIYGVGMDAVHVPRIQRIYKRWGPRFAQQILTPAELEQLAKTKHASRFLALRFAAKEAVAKAMGTGFSQGIGPRQIGVISTENGRPEIEVTPSLANAWQRMGIDHGHISLCDEADMAYAYVTLETNVSVGKR